MSLINDALKRAKQAQTQAPPPALPGPHLRPVEPVPYVRHGVEFLVPTTFAMVALLVLFLVWRWAHQSGPVTDEVRAKSVAPSEQAPVPQVASSPEGSSKEPPTVTGKDNVPPASNQASEPSVVPQSAQPTSVNEATRPAQALNPEPVVTQAVAVVAQELPKPAPLKLQGILFNPTRPSAVINGKPLFLGDRIRDFKVIAIGRDSATLASPGQTNVLNLPE
jgi:hypothetical protein